jgi:D-glycero-alpha-D-manno-heptose-7-phosphate kinase
MIISRTPLRISLFGGGSDLPAFFEKKQGCVVSLSINQYIYISINKLFDSREILLKYSKFERVHSPKELNHKIARELLDLEKINGVDISVNSDVPAGTGMGSSSSFSVGLLKAIDELRGYSWNKFELAEKAIEVELDRLKEPIGLQDHYAAAFGGINRFTFHKGRKVEVAPIILSEDELAIFESSMLLVRVGGTRSASQLLSEIQDNAEDNSNVEVFSELAQMAQNVTKDLLLDSKDLGALLNQSWELKKSTHSLISNSEIEDKMSFGKSAGASGAKLLGAGSSGFILFVGNPDKMNLLRNKFGSSTLIRPRLDVDGSRIIYNSELGNQSGF